MLACHLWCTTSSVLGPLFILYVDDLSSVVSHSIIKLFADDVTIYWYKEIACSTDVALYQHDLSNKVQWDKTSAVAS